MSKCLHIKIIRLFAEYLNKDELMSNPNVPVTKWCLCDRMEKSGLIEAKSGLVNM